MPGLLRGVARTAVIAGTATAVSNRVSRRQGGRWAQQDAQQQQAQEQAQQQAAPPPPPPAAAPPADDMTTKIEQLKQLSTLKEQGVLTETEFAEQKRRLLG
ncbi:MULTISPECIES: SHOCT domain-containing protein [Streptomyces]|uniref:SHOCT domain-containing protein n=1 Tax=Streptomyces TaxID=1883 RepID=UPI0005257541|nr:MULTISPECIES: SHOCT domain-containing protein [Streptomyces]MCX4718550.1 SHOCT domain-containing protein [Streptomyces virginiae]MCX5276187.1 SHOCT domain-containing protein [Streptomyces virginiae]MYV76569.1 SHOCT domain-containing protein [Streptomyces sp. SID1046]